MAFNSYNEYNIAMRFPWDQVAQTVWNPSIKKPKCITSDVISRKTTGNKLHTRRLLQVQYLANPLLAKFVTNNGVVYIVEESVVDREAGSVEVYTHNFPINSLYQVVEKSIFTISPLNSKWTTCTKRAWLNTSLPYGIAGLMERLLFEEYNRSAAQTDHVMWQLLQETAGTKE